MPPPCSPAGAWLPYSGAPGEQQLLLDKHRARRLRVVRRALAVLGRGGGPLREERDQLPARLVVAQPQGAAGRERARLPLHAEARRHGLGQFGSVERSTCTSSQ